MACVTFFDFFLFGCHPEAKNNYQNFENILWTPFMCMMSMRDGRTKMLCVTLVELFGYLYVGHFYNI